ncbi:MAG: radical SAM protein [Pseudomonadota bacterium]
MILIFPPVTKPCEPPAGVSLLAGALGLHGRPCTVIDANIEGLLWVADHNDHPRDSWTRRAWVRYGRNLEDLRSPEVYAAPDTYRQRIMDVNRVLSTSLSGRYRLTLSDYTDTLLSPLDSRDLIRAAQTFEENPFFGYFEESLASMIQASDSNTVGISLVYLSQALTAFALAGWIRVRFPGKTIVMGGGLITSWMSSPAWVNPFREIVDILVPGEGEAAVVDLEGGGFKPRDHWTPDFDFCRWDLYLAPGRILPFRTSFGCYWSRCSFCPERAEKSRYRPGKNSDLLADLETLHSRHRFHYVHFLDNALSPSFLKAIAGQAMPFCWYGFVRFTPQLKDPEFCQALYRSGCRMLNLGLESGDQEVLDRMNKGTDLDTASAILTALSGAGIATYVYVLFGTSYENEASAEKTLEYVARHADRISYLNTAIFNLPRFSEEADTLSTGSFYTGDLSLYLSFTHPLGWERKNVRLFLERRFKKHPAIAAVIRRDPPFFTSNHAMFLKS